MNKRLFALGLALCLLLAAVIPAAATEATEPAQQADNRCGENLTWAYADGVLTITGEGAMEDYLEGGPWSAYQNEITEVVFSGGVTYIGAYAFKDYDALEKVDFGDAMYEIGMEAFWSCDSLEAIYLPETFKIFGESCFESCPNLTQIHSEGVFPSFRQNSMWDTYATIYFPAERPWDVELIQELEEAFHGRIEFRASDGSDPYVPTEPTEPEETEPETQPTTEATTAPTTEAATEPVVTETTAPVETTTTPETEAPETTAAPTEVPEEAEEEDAGPNGIVVGTVIVVVILVLGVLGMLIFGRKKGRGRYAR